MEFRHFCRTLVSVAVQMGCVTKWPSWNCIAVEDNNFFRIWLTDKFIGSKGISARQMVKHTSYEASYKKQTPFASVSILEKQTLHLQLHDLKEENKFQLPPWIRSLPFATASPKGLNLTNPITSRGTAWCGGDLSLRLMFISTIQKNWQRKIYVEN